jgi:hypothetical protein
MDPGTGNIVDPAKAAGARVLRGSSTPAPRDSDTGSDPRQLTAADKTTGS